MVRDRGYVTRYGTGRFGSRSFALLFITALFLWPGAGEVQAVFAPFANISSARFVNVSSASPMTTPRYRHTSTLLSNGKVLVTGGVFNNFSTPTNKAQVYDPRVGAFAPEINLPAARWAHTATMLRDGSVLLAGGRAGSSPLSAIATVEVYRPLTNDIINKTSLSAPRYGHTATRLKDGRVLFAGGIGSGGVAIASIEIYDPVNNSFDSAPPVFTTPRAWHSATLLSDGRVVFIGGRNPGNSSLTAIEVYDPTTNLVYTFPTSGLLNARAYHAAVLRTDGTILVIGGAGVNATEIVTVSNPVSSSPGVAAGPSLLLARYEPSATLLPNGDIVVIGGYPYVPSINIELLRAGGTQFGYLSNLFTADIIGHTATLLPDASILVLGGKESYTAKVDATAQSLILTGRASAIAAVMPGGARQGHSSTRLPDNRVLIAGGWSSSGTGAFTSALLYDPPTKTFTGTTGNMAVGRKYHTATLLPNGMVMLAGGQDSAGSASNTVEIFNPATNTFSTLSPLAAARYDHTATLLPDGRIVVAGGQDGASQLSSLELFTPGVGFQLSTDALATARYKHTANLLKDGRVLFVGGSGAVPLQSAEIYLPAAGAVSGGTWPPASNQISAARTQHVSAMLPDGNVLIAGGTGGGTAEYYDVTLNSFVPLSATMGSFHANGTATVLGDGRVLIAGGSANGSPSSAIDIFDPATRTFSNNNISLSLSLARAGHAASLLNDGFVLLTGGTNGASTWDSADIYEFPVIFTRRPLIDPFTTAPVLPIPTQPLHATLTGSLFSGDSEGSGGTSPSASNHPILTVYDVQNAHNIRTNVDSAAPWTDGTFTAYPLSTPLAQGVYAATITTSGVPSIAQSFYVRPMLSTVPASSMNLTSPAGGINTQPLQITNSGNADLKVYGGTTTGTDAGLFTVSPGTCSTPPFTLAQGQSCALDVGFAPPAGATGTKTATFTIASSDPDALINPFYVTLSGAVAQAPQLSITTSVLPNGTIGANYAAALGATGGAPAYSWAITSGALPPGLSLATSTGVISGIPTTSGNYPFTAQVTDSGSATVSMPLSINVTVLGGSISGIVTTSASTPLASASVMAFDPVTGGSVGTPGFTDANGAYTITGLPPGSYKVKFNSLTNSSNGYAPQYYTTTVSVTSGITTPNINATLVPGGSITGIISDSNGPLVSGGYAYAIDTLATATGTNFASYGIADSTGAYTMAGLPTGSYKVLFFYSGSPSSNYAAQFYNNQPTMTTANPVSVTQGGTTSGINALLVPGGSISGTAKNSSNVGISGVMVNLDDVNGRYTGITGATTASDGTYTITGVPAGSYKVRFNGTAGYVSQMYSGKTSVSLADPVTVVASVTTTGIDAIMAPGGTISGTVKNASATGIGGVTVDVYDVNGGPTVVNSVATKSDGSYQIANVPAGNYKIHFNGSPVGYGDQWYTNKPDVSLADAVTVAVAATTTVDAVLSAGSGISGTVKYTGSKTGRVYLTIQTSNGTLGTSISASGPFSIRGVPPGNYKVNAYMDSLKVGTQVQVSPAGSVDVTLSGGYLGGVNITLTDQTATAPPAPLNVGAAPGDGSVLLGWDRPWLNNVELADSYDIYWGPSAAVSKASNSGSRLDIPAGLDSPVLLDGLTNGAILYFIVIPKSGGIEGTPSAAVGPITVGAPTGGNTVSGTVTYSGPTPGGPLYVVVVKPHNKGLDGAYYTKISPASASQGFTISGIPNGTYAVYALLDMNNDKLFGNGDISNTDHQAPIVVLTGSGATGTAVSLTAKNSEATITTEHTRTSDGTSEWYSIEGSIRSQLKRPVAVTLTGVPVSSSIAVPIDIGLNDREFRAWNMAAVRPAVGDVYSYSVTYDDGTFEAANTATVTGVSDNFPTNAAISGTVSTYPTFTWGAPASVPPTGFTFSGYSLWVDAIGIGDLWDVGLLPTSQLSAIYGFDGHAKALQVNSQYFWVISSLDQFGNRAAVSSSFTPTVAGTPPDTTPPTVALTSPLPGAVNVPVNVVLSVKFSKKIDSSSLPNENTVLKTGTTFITGTGSYDPATDTHTFTPSAPLSYNTTYTMALSGIRDLAGNIMVGTYTASFTTGSTSQITIGTDGKTTATVSVASGDAQISIPAGTLLTDASGNPLSGPLSVSSAVYKADTLPPTAANAATTDGKYLSKLVAAIDIAIGNGTASVKTINPAMTVTLKLPSGYAAGDSVTYYSFDGTVWKQEGTAVVKSDGSVDMTVGHLSMWGVAEFVTLPDGDLNGTGAVDISDALRALQISVGLITPTADELAHGDVAPLVNNRPKLVRKGSITVGDAIVILQKSLGIVGW